MAVSLRIPDRKVLLSLLTAPEGKINNASAYVVKAVINESRAVPFI